MATGKQKVGLAECEFNKKGELVSKKESSIDPKKPMVALTFDDGPGKRTGELLAVSYTHLDVYKRQDTGCGSPIPRL